MKTADEIKGRLESLSPERFKLTGESPTNVQRAESFMLQRALNGRLPFKNMKSNLELQVKRLESYVDGTAKPPLVPDGKEVSAQMVRLIWWLYDDPRHGQTENSTPEQVLAVARS